MHPTADQAQSRRLRLASVTALASVFTALSCCVFPWSFLAAAGAATGSAFLSTLRPYLLGVAAACVAFGFYQSWRARQCQAKPRLLNSILLWFSALAVVFSVLFPQVLANLLAG